MRRFLTGLAIASLLFATPLASHAQQALRPPKLNITQHTLPNGLKVVALEDHSAPVVNVQVWYHVGSKDEVAGRTGFAHLFEHIMFKGSANLGPQEHAQKVQDVGGVLNAGTNFDYTYYYETVPSNALAMVLWLEAERMASLKVDDDNLKSERDVVIEEKRQRFENTPFGKLGEIVLSTAFTTHSYKWTPIGSKEDLEAASLTDVQKFHATYYVPNNATLVVVGDFKTADMLKSVDEYFGKIPKSAEALPRPAKPEPQQTAERRRTEYDSKVPLPAVIVAYHVPELGGADTYPLEVASLILSGGESSRLYQRMVYEKQMALAANGSSFLLEDYGLFFFLTILNAGTAPDAGETELSAEIERLKNEPVTAAELEKAKTQLIAGVTLGRQTVEQKATAIGQFATLLDDPNLVNTELDRLQKVTAEDIQRVARKYFTKENRSVIFMLPESMKQAAAEGGESK